MEIDDMDIQTKFGIAKNIKIEPYGNGTYTLAYINKRKFIPTDEEPYGEDAYDLFGFDAPIDDDPEWRFWVEFGDFNGESETYNAEISDDDKEKIKQMYYEYMK